MKRRIPRPSPALIVAILALAVATSGTAFAVTSQDGDTLITVRTLSGDRLRLNTVTRSEMVNLSWDGVILQNGWVSLIRAPKAAVDAQGLVHLQGAVVNGTSKVIGTLPTSARPTVTIYLTAHNNKGATVGIVLQPIGRIVVQATIGPNMYVGFDGLTYAR
jgi:predicted small integral membrane protein